MNQAQDHYAILGVLPAAEDVVIRAAYRALSQKYHPDVWVGERAEATRRMQQINEAYAVLSNAAKREEYDHQRSGSTNDEFDFDDEAMRSAFREAETEQEADWTFATDYFPDLQNIHRRLRRISDKLAFEYRSVILASKEFARRHEVADALEANFLTRYFGSNVQILEFARELIETGKKDAAKELNRAVTVLGNSADPELIVARIKQRYFREDVLLQISQLARAVVRDQYVSQARELIEKLGGAISRGKRTWLFSDEPLIVHLEGERQTFRNDYEMTQWVVANVAPRHFQ